MNPIRKEIVTFGECDSFDEVHKYVNDLYRIAHEHRAAIEAIQSKLESKKKAKKR